jgi:hypothetical protein
MISLGVDAKRTAKGYKDTGLNIFSILEKNGIWAKTYI